MPEEKNMREIVRKWIDDNKYEFVKGTPEKYQKLYRDDILDKCSRHIGAPKDFLETRLKMIPEETKYYLTVFQTLILASFVAVVAFFLYGTVNSGMEWMKTTLIFSPPASDPPSNKNPLEWLGGSSFVIFIANLIILVILSLPIVNRKIGQKFSDFVQRKTRIVYNLRELQIEMYYISKILEIRKNNEEVEK